jgi:hypothetical protein
VGTENQEFYQLHLAGALRGCRSAVFHLNGPIFTLFSTARPTEILGAFFFIGVNSLAKQQLTHLTYTPLLCACHFL